MDFESSLGRGRWGHVRAPKHPLGFPSLVLPVFWQVRLRAPSGKGSAVIGSRRALLPQAVTSGAVNGGVLWQSGPAVKHVWYLTECVGQGRQVPVVHPTGVQLGDEGDQCVGPRSTAWGYQHLLLHGGFVDFDDPVDELDCGAPRGGCRADFPGPVTT